VARLKALGVTEGQRDMQKVLVIGSGGSRKTTFSIALAEKTGLPLIHLDAIYWRPGWEQPPKQEWRSTVDRLIQQPAWIIDGDYRSTLSLRLGACDTAILLDISPWICTYSVLKRMLTNLGKSRPDMPENCPERFDPEFLWWVASYRAKCLPSILSELRDAERLGKTVVILRSRSEMKRFLSGLPHNHSLKP
jgi:adenylate kinase family enzyme